MTDKSVIQQLEDWEYQHKRHSVRITHDDGYGAGCGWEVELWVTSLGSKPPDVRVFESNCNNLYRDADPLNLTIEQEWPGLEWTILEALRQARIIEDKE